ncbi:MAG TPA: universal stress protein [Acidimicrobiales bacterium]|nr:universal stress protein [Acidimicrobiales bacterium]
MTTRAHILVPVDGSAATKRAIGYAVKLAERLNARISFAHVQAPIGEVRATEEEGQAMLASIAAAYPNIDAPTALVVGNNVACAICEAFPDAIVVIGSDHATRHASGTIESIAEAMVREAHHHPILVVGPHVQTTSLDGPIAIALDGSTVAEDALLATLTWARVFDTPLHLVQVVSTKATRSDGSRPSDYLESVQAHLSAGGLDAECHLLVDADPVAGLVRHLAQHGCSLVMMSTHSRRGLERAAFGSVTMGVIAAGPCAVCAVHPETVDPLELEAGPLANHAQLVRRRER